MATQTAVSLAVLQVNWDRRKHDYLDNFVPIVAECVRLLKYEVVTVDELRNELESRFGLRFPQAAINTILGRLRKKGYVRLEDEVYYKNPDQLSSLDFRKVQQEVIRMHDSLIRHMVDYCKREFGVRWSSDEAENHLLACLRENDLQIMTAVTSGTLIPDITPLTKTSKYYVAKYMQHLQDTQPAELDYLEKIVEGNMLANAIFLPDPARAEQKFRNTKIFFDTSFLIFALGYAGKPRQEPSSELLEILYETGGNLCYFQHTVNEIKGILDSCAQRIRNGETSDQYGSIEYFIEKNFSDSDILLLSVNLERDLAAINVRIKEKPPYTEEFVIDEEALGKALEKEIKYRRPQARNRDVDSLSAIMRLRRMEDYYILEDCKALFISTNSAVSKVARQFFYKEDCENAIAPCITDYTLTNLLWLKKPLKLPDLPRKRIIADCYAALQPDENLVRAYLTKIKQKEDNGDITADEVFLLRHSMEAKQALMDLTSGDERGFAQGTINEILALIKERIQAAARAEIEVKEQEKIKKVIRQRDKTKKQLDEKSQELEQTYQEIESLTAGEIMRKANIKTKSRIVAHWISRVCEFILVAVLVLGTISIFPWKLPTIGEAVIRYTFSILFLIASVLVILNLIKGITIESIVRTLEIKIQKWVENLIHRFEV